MQWIGHCTSGYAIWRTAGHAGPDDRQRMTGGNVRTIIRLGAIAGALAVAACSKDKSAGADFQKDLERASTASEITLPSGQPGTQVVSAIERTTPPAPRKIAQSQRAPRHKAAPTRTPAPVQAEQSDLSTEVEPAPVEPTPTPTDVAPLPSPRPQPVASSGGGSGDGQAGRGRGDTGIGIGTVIGVILRGGIVDGDDCDPRSDGRRHGGTILINNRIPPIGVGTFPGSGRIGGARIGSGRIRF
jgi:hypothetical protein